MRNHFTILLAVASAVFAGCDGYRGPRLSVPVTAADKTTSPTAPPPATTPPAPPAAPAAASKPDCNGPYCGLTLAEWGKQLSSSDRDEVMEACRALRVLGPEGRPHLVTGLDNPRPETRRLCLESLTLDDFKKEGETGRKRLVKLAGDRADIRIRERASAYLMQWHSSVLAP